MKIAVPTNDGFSVSEHFGRSAGFLVFEIQDGRIVARETRANTMQHTHGQGGPHAEAEGAHSHTAILAALAGCDVVICAGMGWRAAEALKEGGVGTVIRTGPGPAEERVAAYLAGNLRDSGPAFCRCSH